MIEMAASLQSPLDYRGTCRKGESRIASTLAAGHDGPENSCGRHFAALTMPGKEWRIVQDDAPRVLGIYTAASAGEPMRSHESVEVEAGIGIAGDRYATRLGHWSDPKWRDQQLTLVGMDLLNELGLSPDALRRNIVTSGIELNDLIGLEFGIGSVVMRGKRICAPCGYIGRLNNRKGLFTELDGRGGIRVSVVQSGVMRVGDEIRVLGIGDAIEADEPEVHEPAG